MKTAAFLHPTILLALLTGVTFAALQAPAADAPREALSVEGLPLGAEAEFSYRSPLALSAGSADTLFVANHTGMSVEAVRLSTGEIIGQWTLDGAPSGLTWDAESQRLYVTRGLAHGAVDVIDTAQMELIHSFPTGHTPTAPVLSPDGKTLYVANRFDNEVAAYATDDGTVRARVEGVREPVGAALTPDGARLVVAQHLPAQPSNSAHVAAKVDLIDTGTLAITASAVLPSGSTGVRAVAISPDGRYAYVTHTLGRFQLPTTQLERGWMNTSAISIIDIEEQAWLTSVLLDDVDRGAANPWGVTVTDDGAQLLVTHSGAHEISVIDRLGLHEKIDRVADGQIESHTVRTLADIPNDLSFLVDLRERVALPGNGPRGIVAIDSQAVVAEYFTDSLAVVDLDQLPRRASIRQVALGTPREPGLVRRGEIAFYDASLCFQNWQSCASCHPDARADALNWDLLNDGIGNPKNNRTMLHTHDTPPVMITGIRPKAEVAVRAGFRFIQFINVQEEVAESVDAYLKALTPVPSPWLVDGQLSEAARRGWEIFEQAGCAECHTGEYYTDGKLHDVGTGPDELGIRKFVTPHLIEVWRTAPYLYDGRAPTMLEVFTEHNEGDRHGRTSSLSEQELADLVEFVLSL